MKRLHVLLVVALSIAACSAPPPPPVAAAAPALPAVSLLRQSLGPAASPSPGAALYLYLLVGSHEADGRKYWPPSTLMSAKSPRTSPPSAAPCRRRAGRSASILFR